MLTGWLLDTSLRDVSLSPDSFLGTEDAAEQKRNPIFIFMVSQLTVLSLPCFCTEAMCSLQVATFLIHKAHRHIQDNTSKGKTKLENKNIDVDNGTCDAHNPWVVKIN